MSYRVNKNFLSSRDINQIKNDCFVEGRENQYGPAQTLRAYGETANAMYIPFAYAKTRFEQSPNKDIVFPRTNYNFYSDKYPFRTDRDQEAVFNEAMGLLKKHRSALLSLFCSFGKCLAKGTPILMYDGTIKNVEDIKVGDVLMGDDSKPRNVLSLARGREEMYDVIPEEGPKYTVNKSHILSLKKATGEVVDISVKDYLLLQDKDSLKGYRVEIDFARQKPDKNPYLIGYNLNVDIIPHVYKCTCRQVRLEILAGIIDARGFHIQLQNECLIDDIIYISRSLGLLCYKKYDSNYYSTVIHGNVDIIPVRKTHVKPDTNTSLTYGITVKSVGEGDYYGFTIDGNHRFLLGDFTVTHNTYEAIRIAQACRLKCGILAHRGILFDQWMDSFTKFTDAKGQMVGTDGVLDPEADYYVFNIAYVHKKWDKKLQTWVPKKLGIYKGDIGLLIVDEAHMACAAEMSRALLYFNPRLMLALTATPVRKDGMDKVLELYFGAYDKTRIIRIATDPFTVYRLPTGIKPAFTRNSFGKKDWNSVITSLVENEDRNKLIVDLIKKFHDFNIIVLTKRKSHCNLLSKMLTHLEITNTVMVGTSKTYDNTARVLLSTYSKLGVGFDDTRLNMLIVACSVTEVEQYAGRLRDAVGKKRVIIDLVDEDSNCLSHWQERRKWYISRNGEVKHYYKEFPKEEEKEVKEVEESGKTEPKKRLARRI